MFWFRGLLSWLFLMPLLASGGNAQAVDTDWALFKSRFVQADGRVVADSKADISHSEGQGATMFLAARYGDRAAFQSVWRWTREKLQVRDDKLLAWRWAPGAGVTDLNNATDGDIFVAWALLRSYRQWGDPAELSAALEILRFLRERALRVTSRGTLLLPGLVGFDHDEGLMLNLSYWVFPAFAEFALVDNAAPWNAVRDSGLRLLQEGRFGRWGLPVDWMYLGKPLKPAGKARFSYDAVRIPLYLAWARLDHDSTTEPFKAFWRYFKGAQFLPAWTDVRDDSIDSYNASLGIQAITQLVLRDASVPGLPLPPLDERQDYYSALLLLLTKTAFAEIVP